MSLVWSRRAGMGCRPPIPEHRSIKPQPKPSMAAWSRAVTGYDVSLISSSVSTRVTVPFAGAQALTRSYMAIVRAVNWMTTRAGSDPSPRESN